jgi:DNA-binding CsgD family transcriptional regulator
MYCRVLVKARITYRLQKELIGSEIKAFEIDETAFSKNSWIERCKCFKNRHGLTDREFEVMFLFSKSQTADAISQVLCIAPATVRAHIFKIYKKTDTHSRAELNRKINEAALTPDNN